MKKFRIQISREEIFYQIVADKKETAVAMATKWLIANGQKPIIYSVKEIK